MQKIGILGGGQLGRMLLQAAANYVVETFVLENDDHCPAAHLCHHFVKGDIRDFDTVYNFGKDLNALTIEIEAVNVDALEKLEAEGVKVYPRPAAIRIIRNKVIQKEFYKQHGVPTAAFLITQTKEEIKNQLSFLPAVHKMVDIKKEIAIIVGMNEQGQTAIYPPAEMIFDPVLNLLDYQLSPAQLPQQVLWKAEAMALRVVKELKSPGLFAVELFIDRNDYVLINETAPRVHNSGHHTIEANYSSQYDMLWRILLGYPLGNPAAILPSSIVNLVGAEGHSGEAVYEGLPEVLKMDNVFVHLYGKTQTKPGRKMGHVTIISNDRHELTHKAHKIKHTLKVISKPA